MKMTKVGIGCGMALLAGCLTISQSTYPKVSMSPVTKGLKVQVEGFMTTEIEYTPVYASGTYVVSAEGPFAPHPHFYAAPAVGTYTTATYTPTLRNSDTFLRRAQDNLEKAGCLLRAAPAKYTVSCTFGGPLVEESSRWNSAGVFVGSVFSARFERLAYTAEVKVYEAATGQLVFTQAYTQDYYASGWSPIPIFCIPEFEKLNSGYVKGWCLSALTDRVTADVSAFFATQR